MSRNPWISIPVDQMEQELRKLRDRAEKAEADFLACAQAIGVSYEAWGHNSAPGPIEDVVEHIKRAVRMSGELIDAELRAKKAEKRANELEDYANHAAVCSYDSYNNPDPSWCDCGLYELLHETPE